jgi:SOUL heme-binding protein
VNKMWIALLILIVAAALVLAGCKATRAGYESATYRVVRSSGKFQVRDYPALTVVETPTASRGNGADGSFNRLFRFMSSSRSSALCRCRR